MAIAGTVWMSVCQTTRTETQSMRLECTEYTGKRFRTKTDVRDERVEDSTP